MSGIQDDGRAGAKIAMSELFRSPAVFTVDPTRFSRTRYWLIGAKQLFWIVALLTLVALALELGAYRKELKIAGPFAAETNPARHSLVLNVPQEGQNGWWRQPLTGDDNGQPFRSLLELWIDSREMGPPHTLHETIREGKTTGFSHWGGQVIFSLPPGVKNAPETIATLRYSVRPRGWLTFTLVFLSTLLGWLGHANSVRSLARRDKERLAAAALRTPYLMLFGLCGLGLTASAIFIASSLYAFATGWALPTTALLRWSPSARWAAGNESHLGQLLLMLSGFGTLVTWLVGSRTPYRQLAESNELLLRRLLVWSGFPIAACALMIYISAIWIGMVRPGDYDYANIGGLVPFSDANYHLSAAYDQARDGTWITFAQRRPLAAAARSVLLLFSDYSLPIMLVLQASLVAAAACFAAHAVALWRGIWAAIAFFGLTYIYARTFVPTTLTESLGLFWALLSVPFFIEALRSRSVESALIAFALTSVALMTRMGSMFTIPALLIWLVWQFGTGAAAKFKIAIVAVGVLLCVLGLNSLLEKAYGTGEGSTGSNFSYTLCGLSIGTAWDGCPAQLAAEGEPLRGDEATVARQLYSMAWKNISARPQVFLRRLADGAKKFVAEFPDVIWRGYGLGVREPDWLFRKALTALSLLGISYIAARRAKSIELTFWALVWASIVASSSMVYFDDGSRTLAVSHPLIALFFAIGLSNPLSVPEEASSRPRLARHGSLGLIAAAALLVCVPWIAHRLSPIGAMGANGLTEKQDEAFVFGGRRMSGFLVIENHLPLRSDVPTLHLADFEAIIAQGGVESDQELLHPVSPPLPFGFVFAPDFAKGPVRSNIFIVPADVVERRSIPAWHFSLKPWHHNNPNAQSGDWWFYVTKAEPWPG
jgi:hypothetical protein